MVLKWVNLISAATKHMGRPSKTTEADRITIREALRQGATVTSMATKFTVSRATIISLQDAVEA